MRLRLIVLFIGIVGVGLLAAVLLSATDAPVTTDTAAITDADGADVGLRVGQRAPDFSAPTLDGGRIALSDLRGEVVLLNFWATWCGPCRVEMPDFQQQHEALRDQGFSVLAVNNREHADQVVAFRDELGLTFPIALDPTGAVQDQYALFSYPSSYLIDRDGTVLARHFGVLTGDALAALLDEALSPAS